MSTEIKTGVEYPVTGRLSFKLDRLVVYGPECEIRM